MKDGTRTVSEHRGQWIRKGLVVAEIALALTLLVGAGLLIRSFARLQQVDPPVRRRAPMDQKRLGRRGP